MKWYTTRNHNYKVDFRTALFESLAPDKGLYMPEFFPAFTPAEIKDLKDKSVPEIGFRVIRKFIQDDIPEKNLKKILKSALTFPVPLRKVGDYYILELFHGPTMAFKDIAAQFLARLMEYYLSKSQRKLTVLVATSGDTGGAVAQGFADSKHINVVILFPKGRVSQLQEKQLTHVSGNIFPIEVEGSFDDCQQFIKQAFSDRELSHLNLSTANSINIGRLLPQMTYYVWTAMQLYGQNLRFIVPSGNMGNVTAGLFAKRLGVPIDHFIVACNANDAVVEYYKTSIFTPKPSVSTLSNAMDIGNPSNFERILDVCENDHNRFRQDITAVSIKDDEIVTTIKNVYNTHSYLLDPHTAVAWTAAEKLPGDQWDTIIVSTASPKKFATEIQQATGIEYNENSTGTMSNRPQRKYAIENSYDAFKDLLNSMDL